MRVDHEEQGSGIEHKDTQEELFDMGEHFHGLGLKTSDVGPNNC